MDQSPAAFFYKADATDNGYRGATGFRGFGDFSVDVLLLTGSGGGGENLLPTCVLCHVSRCRHGTWVRKHGCPCAAPLVLAACCTPARVCISLFVQRPPEQLQPCRLPVLSSPFCPCVA